MAEVKVTKHAEFLEDHGDDYRIERNNRVDEDGTYSWTVFERKSTGLELHEEHLKAMKPGEQAGDHYQPGVRTHHPSTVKKMGEHPIIKQKIIVTNTKGEDEIRTVPVATVFSHVWVPVFKGKENAARMRLQSLVEGKK